MYENKMTPLCSSRRTESNHVLFDLDRSISKFDLGSGQVKIRPRSDHDLSRSICTSSEAVRPAIVVLHHLRVSISILSQLIGENGL